MAQPADSVSALSHYQWQNRLVLLFAPTAEDGRFREQGAVFAGAPAGLKDRDLVVFRLFGNSGYEGEKSLTRDEVAALREQFEVEPNAFTLILIGKDGTVKRRAEEVVTIDDLFTQIDAMPMRQREMDAP